MKQLENLTLDGFHGRGLNNRNKDMTSILVQMRCFENRCKAQFTYLLNKIVDEKQ